MTTVTLKAGTYWIGDLCYVMHDVWDEVCSRVIEGDDVLEGKFGLADGREFVMFNTAYGDGTYNDHNLNDYPVDSGNIGAILLTDIRESKDNDTQLGHVYTFDTDVTCDTDSGTIRVGHVYVYTGDQDDDNEDDYYEDEDDSYDLEYEDEGFLFDEA
jgi:hypothetical protein